MSTKAQALIQQLDELENRVTSIGFITQDQINEWVSDSVSLFDFLGVNSEIIKSFLQLFDSFILSGARVQFFHRWEDTRNQDIRITGFATVSMAFKTARKMISGIAEAERLVPVGLIDLLRQNYSHLALSLESMQTAYEGNDSAALVSSSVTLLDAILDLDPGLKAKNKIGAKLSFLQGQSGAQTLQRFGVDPELIIALNNSRLIRNTKIVHKSPSLKHNLPFLVSLGSAYLVLMFLETTMATGQLIK